MTPVVYLHGFASSPSSTKARFFAERMAALGVPFEAPRLDEGDFRNLTITRQLAVIDQSVHGREAVLIGSSLGGYLAALYAARHPQVRKLVLMAPAFDAARRWRERLGPGELARWKRDGSLPFFHYGENRQMALGYDFLEDLERYEAFPEFPQPGLVFQGRQDPVVPLEVTEHFATRHRNVDLRVLESGHELTDVLDILWEGTSEFLDLWDLSPVLK